MKKPNKNQFAIYLLLPILMALLLNLNPLPLSVVKNLNRSLSTSKSNQAEIQADALISVAEYYPWRGDLWEKAGLNYFAVGNDPEAIVCLIKAASINKISNVSRLILGDAYLNLSEYQLAISTWEELLLEGGSTNDIYPRLLHTYILERDYQLAFDLLGSSTEWVQASAEDVYQLGLILSINQPESALKVLAEAGRLDPNLEPSILIIDKGINGSNADDPLSYRLLLIGRALGTLGEWQLAKTAFNQASQLSPDYAEAWAFLSEAQQQLGEDGLPALNKALLLEPNSILIQGFMAIYWEDHKKPELALVYLNAIAEQQPTNGMWQVELGNTMVEIGDLVSALAHFQTAINIEPGNPSYWRDLANFSLSYNVQLNEIGLPAARQAVALDPENATGVDLLGQFFLVNYDLISAERMFLRAVGIDPNNAWAQFHLGLTYQEEGDQVAAYQTLKLAETLATSTPLLDQIQQTLALVSP